MPLAVLGPTLTLPCTVAETPVAGEALRFRLAPVTEMSPILTELARAVSDSEGTPLMERNVPLKTTGEVLMPGMVRPVEERLTDQLSRFARVPVKPMVEVTPDKRTATFPRTVIPLAPISAESALTTRLSRTGCSAAISSPVTAAMGADAALPCSEGTSLPSARTAPSTSMLAAGLVQSVPDTVVVSASTTTSSLTKTALSAAGGASATLSQKVQNFSTAVGPLGAAGLQEAATPPRSATLNKSAENFVFI